MKYIVGIREAPTAAKKQNKLQFGFLDGLSPAMVVLLVMEITTEHRDQGLPIFMVELDTQKASYKTIQYRSKLLVSLAKQSNLGREWDRAKC